MLEFLPRYNTADFPGRCKWLLSRALWVYLVCFALVVLGVLLTGEEAMLGGLLALPLPYLIYGQVLVGVLGLLLRSYSGLFGLGFFGLSLLTFPGLLRLPLPASGGALPDSSCVVVSYNLNYLRTVVLQPEAERPRHFAAFYEFLKQQGSPDFLCVQETSSASYRPIARDMGYAHYFGHKGTMIFSRRPFLDKGHLDFGATDNSCTWVDVEIQGQRVRLYSAHLQSSRASGVLAQYLLGGHIFHRNGLVLALEILRRYGESLRERRRQASMLMEHIRRCPWPVILCGDFNEPPTSLVYRRMSRLLQDSFRLAGSALGATYGSPFPFLRLDYVFCSPSFRVLEHQVLRRPYSDHFPVVVRFGWASP